jgi:hypothetical protein
VVPPAGPARVILGTPRPIVPGPGLPDGLTVGRSNNNLDVAWHDGRLWLAWRTAPSHFASADAAVHVVVSDDGGVTWTHDHTVAPGRDLREPRLVSWQGTLLMYWFTAGTSGTSFAPDRIWVSSRDRTGPWRAPLAISPPDCVVWRVRPVAGRLAMTLYRGAGSLFTRHPVPLTVEMWASDDGLAWEPLDPARPVVHDGGSETEFIELPDGRVLSVVRKEGPEGGWGADIGISHVGPGVAALSRGRWRADPRKFDSPLLFLDRGRPWLVTRRHLAFGGGFDLDVGPLRRLSPGARTKLDQAAYWLTPKRTALYAIDPDALTATWVTDLPSAGDTAFAGEVPVDPAHPDDGRHLIFNYSSRVDRGWWPWVAGQLRPTHIYAIEATIAP